MYYIAVYVIVLHAGKRDTLLTQIHGNLILNSGPAVNLSSRVIKKIKRIIMARFILLGRSSGRNQKPQAHAPGFVVKTHKH